jgi:hypothetical protein
VYLADTDNHVIRVIRSATGHIETLIGSFRDAFRNRVLFVVGTKGSAAENAWALAKARFDAESFWYRGNGMIEIVLDTDFDAAKEPDRNVVLYGNADTNAAWKPLLGDGPVTVKSGSVTIGPRTEKGDDWACLFVRPRPDSEKASVGVVSGSGLAGMRLTDRVPYFASGVGFPNFSSRSLSGAEAPKVRMPMMAPVRPT